jgi:hypothetical protein
METETPAESIVVDEAENQSFLGFKFGAIIDLEKSVVFQQLRKRLWTTWIQGETEAAGNDSSFGKVLGVGVINIAQTASHKFGQSCVGSMGQTRCSRVSSADPKPKRR